MPRRAMALSLKQPWAALLAYAHKSIEVRAWPTDRRGRVLIHAAKVSDTRPEAWAHVPPELHEATQLVGGIVGIADLTGCLEYRDRKTFIFDRPLHLNDPRWFRPPVLYGFIFSRPRVLPFRPFSGYIKFFPVPSRRES